MKYQCVKNDGTRCLTVGKIYDGSKSSFSGVFKSSFSGVFIKNDCDKTLVYNSNFFREVKMEKQIVTIDVGSEIIFDTLKEVRIVREIDLDAKVVKYSVNGNNNYIGYDAFLDFFNFKECGFKSINGINISEIEEVRIKGFNDKVTLKVGDILSITKEINEGEKKGLVITGFSNIEIATVSGIGWQLPLSNSFSDWYVNGKLYAKQNIIIPNQVVDKHEEIDQPVQDNEMVEPITRDNILEVLKYNKVSFVPVTQDNELVGIDFYRREELTDKYYCYLHNEKWLQHLEIETGKLKPLPKFDFEEYINKNSHQFNRAFIAQIASDLAEGKRPSGLICNEHNAKVICKIYELVEDLK